MKITIELEELIDLLTKKKLTTSHVTRHVPIEAQPVVVTAPKKPKAKRTTSRVPNTGWLQEAINLVAKGTDYKKIGRILTRKGYTTRHGKPVSSGAVSAALWRFNHNVDTAYARKNV